MPYYKVTCMVAQEVVVTLYIDGDKAAAEKVAAEKAQDAVVACRSAGTLSNFNGSYNTQGVNKPVVWQTDAEETEPPKPIERQRDTSGQWVPYPVDASRGWR